MPEKLHLRCYLSPKCTVIKISATFECLEFILILICDALRDLVSFVQFKKREKHPWRSVTKITLLKLTLLHGCFSRFLNSVNGTKWRNAPYLGRLKTDWHGFDHLKFISFLTGLILFEGMNISVFWSINIQP